MIWTSGSRINDRATLRSPKDLFKSLQTMPKYIYWTKLVVNYSNTNDRTVKTVNN